jgi:CO/xanthine dehydrogenase Mo-binding subunit
VARKLGMDPYEFRMKNLMEEGDITLTGGHYEAIKAKETLKAAAKAAGYSTAKGKYIGRGVAMGYRGPGGGTTSLKVELGADGSIVIQTSFFEQGTGTYTTLRQIVAEELGCDPEVIQIRTVDTDSGVSSDTGLGGSRGTRVASGAAFQAGRAAKEELLGLAQVQWGWPKNDIVLSGSKIVNKKTKKQRSWSELLAQAGRSITGEAVNKDDDHSPVTAFAAQVAEVAVDPETGEVTLRRLTTAHDTGVIMNPVGHQGQIDGGVVQGIGYGLIEHLPVQDGRVEVANFGEYKIPTIKDIPALKTVIVASGEGVGPYHVKGIGENPISPAAPAIANAIEDAVGVRIKDLPITAEKIYAAMRLEKSK